MRSRYQVEVRTVFLIHRCGHSQVRTVFSRATQSWSRLQLIVMEFHVRVESDPLPLGVGRAVCRNDLNSDYRRTHPATVRRLTQSSARHTRGTRKLSARGRGGLRATETGPRAVTGGLAVGGRGRGSRA